MATQAPPRRSLLLALPIFAAAGVVEGILVDRAFPVVQEPSRRASGLLACAGVEAVVLGGILGAALLAARLARRPLAGSTLAAAVAILAMAPIAAQLARRPSAPAAPVAGGSPAAPSVLLVTIDTLRQDHVGVYGARAATPVLDGVAARGATFESAYCQAPLTAPSHASLLWGVNPPRHGSRYNGVTAQGDGQGLASILSRHGYRTAAFVSASVLTASMSGLHAGFQAYDEELLPAFPSQQLYRLTAVRLGLRAAGVAWPERRAEAAVERALAFLEDAARHPQPSFCWLHLYDPHMPYDPPARFARELDPGYGGSFEVNRRSVVELREGRIAPTPEDLEHGRRMYAAEVAYVDATLARVVEAASDSSRPFLVVVTSDHGESLGEHGYTFFHGENLHWPSMRVPLVMSGPGVPAGTRIPALVRLVDVMPTILDLLGLPPAPDRDGRSLRPLLEGREMAEVPSYGEDGQQLYLAPHGARVKLETKDVAIRTRETLFVTRPATGAEELYDLRDDPGELRNRAEDLGFAEVKASLTGQLMSMTDFATYVGDGATFSVDDEEARKALQQLGYISGAGSGGATPPLTPPPAPSGAPAP